MQLSRSMRVGTMLALSMTMFVVELTVGVLAGSITLVADSFHMLNDVLGLGIALWAIAAARSTKAVPHNTYGWQRAEILGALTNGVLLLGLCLTIYIDAAERFVKIEEVSNPKLVTVVGCVGLAFNLLGLVLFHEHAHGHGHSHEHGHAHGNDDEESVVGEHQHLLSRSTDHDAQSSAADNRSIIGVPHPVYTQRAIIRSAQQMDDSDSESDHGIPVPAVRRQRRRHSSSSSSSSSDHHGHHAKGGSGGHLNMQGVWLHIFGDCITNVAVIVSGLVIWQAEGAWRFYFDPAMSVLINTLIVTLTIPLVKSASRILLNGVPSGVDLDSLRRDLQAIPHVMNVHDLHVWQLSDTKNIGSVHVLIDRPPSHQCIHNSGASSIAEMPEETAATSSTAPVRLVSRNKSRMALQPPSSVDMDCLYMDVATNVKRAMHAHGIHSTTIQPEFVVGQPVSVATTKVPTGESASMAEAIGRVIDGHPECDFTSVAIAPTSRNDTAVVSRGQPLEDDEPDNKDIEKLLGVRPDLVEDLMPGDEDSRSAGGASGAGVDGMLGKPPSQDSAKAAGSNDAADKLNEQMG
ncbi:Zinc resistance conferring protein, partial [Coemansia sp. RSA 552]